ncbi:diaminopimelate decarboxylase [Siculibacillus lacustris]|uniref:Diaminopimelate decarboxylase n=1 Tax=Siculibacillus lacustris TaxID=1549641 RepID=A0A4Q9VJ77_9HYPH|nr:diaminopimelate decarboxylase [Siculibacillus lacustris]TBW35107.1 diaminopimelate decarboxylase [Siculibacillus lacustris]
MIDLARRLPPSAFGVVDGQLAVEGVAIAHIAAEVGTPFYLYSAKRLRENWRTLADAVAPLGVAVHYAMKANANRAVVAVLAREGAGADIVSGGELTRALDAGIPANRIVFSGVGKTDAEIARALDVGIRQINAESFEELARIDALAGARGVVAEVALRVNPDVDAGTHAKITTGKRDNKFGIDADRLARLDNELKVLANVRLVGLAVHIGSQILSTAPFAAAYRRMADLTRELRARGHALTRLDLGGGFGIPYRAEAGLAAADLAETIRTTVGDLGVELAIEPGRSIVGDAGVLVSRVAFVKDGGDIRFLVLDAAMNDLMRPAMYDSHHDVVPVRMPAPGAERIDYDVVGPICESSDTFARRRSLPILAAGDLVVLATAGAYGATMAGTYNARALVPEVIVDAGRFAVTRRRIEVEEQLSWETVPDWL